MISNNKTIISYYQGSYGPTIRIDVQEIEWLQYFRENIVQLVENKLGKIDITCMDNVEVVDIDSLELIKVQYEKSKKVFMLNEKLNTNHFIWHQDIEELITIVGLIDGLLDSDNSGHQYLTDGGACALILLAYKEY